MWKGPCLGGAAAAMWSQVEPSGAYRSDDRDSILADLDEVPD